MEFTIPTPADYNFKENHRFLARSANECLHFLGDNYIEKALCFDKQVYIFGISEGDAGLKIKFLLGKPDHKAKKYIVDYIKDWLDLETDLTPFYALAEKDAVLAPLVLKFRGLRLIGIPELFESLVWSIIGQQINLGFAYTLKRRVVERYGQAIVHQDKTYYVLPAPSDILAHPVEALEALKMTRRKAEYIYGIAKLLDDQSISKEKLQEFSLDNGIKNLVAIRGIGAWTANYVLMKCLRHPDAFPIADVGLHNGLKAALGRSEKPTIEEIQTIAKSWKGWEAYATFYLWQSLL